ncbi:MAG: hypothetical protein ACE5I3_09805 [Phycisphaerae bacterium]
MGKLAKLLIVVAIIAIAGYAILALNKPSGDGPRADAEQRHERPRLEEKYGFTSETVGD